VAAESEAESESGVDVMHGEREDLFEDGIIFGYGVPAGGGLLGYCLGFGACIVLALGVGYHGDTGRMTNWE
jgi:hypothetical protein